MNKEVGISDENAAAYRFIESHFERWCIGNMNSKRSTRCQSVATNKSRIPGHVTGIAIMTDIFNYLATTISCSACNSRRRSNSRRRLMVRNGWRFSSRIRQYTVCLIYRAFGLPLLKV